MSEKLTVAEVLPFIDRTVDGVKDLPAEESHWTNGEVLELLDIIRDALRSPEWAQVQVEEVLRERDGLRRTLHAERVDTALSGLLYRAAIDIVVGERDRARGVASRLEAELARSS